MAGLPVLRGRDWMVSGWRGPTYEVLAHRSGYKAVDDARLVALLIKIRSVLEGRKEVSVLPSSLPLWVFYAAIDTTPSQYGISRKLDIKKKKDRQVVMRRGLAGVLNAYKEMHGSFAVEPLPSAAEVAARAARSALVAVIDAKMAPGAPKPPHMFLPRAPTATSTMAAADAAAAVISAAAAAAAAGALPAPVEPPKVAAGAGAMQMVPVPMAVPDVRVRMPSPARSEQSRVSGGYHPVNYTELLANIHNAFDK
ncbi:hypothetical protein HYH03_001963 [Edaphochlamys debaryana]|uniref:Uncharacterized protein n=1 Tax=Edaphochlamys debaryana TaxID=47281 RepID=A0A835YGA5_9CHLO|nr:hypothetical protein HYH03_001963 [Edaphochlamys debaryana]|eukprot:KAG2500391.1 hypothetical protein HYH03_001963 [Edaphochlamys debaryana]